MSVLPSQFDTLRQVVQVSSLRHSVIARNLANVNTPGFRAQEVPFEEELGQLLADRRGAELAPGSLIRETLDANARQDGNTVDINREMGKLNRNALMHQAYLQILATKLSQMRSAITGN